jgi:hypothetical protein
MILTFFCTRPPSLTLPVERVKYFTRRGVGWSARLEPVIIIIIQARVLS